MLELSQVVRVLREAKSWTAAELASRAGIACSTLSMLEHSTREPSVSTLVKLASALGVDLSVLLWPVTKAFPSQHEDRATITHIENVIRTQRRLAKHLKGE